MKNELNIPKIYYINLNRSKERNEFMINQFNKYNIENYKRIEAIDGKTDNLEEYIIYNIKIGKLTLACTVSHLKALKQVYDDSIEEAIILEDDIILDPLITHIEKYNNLIKSLPEDLDILQLYTSNSSFYNYKKYKNSFYKYSKYEKKNGCAGMYYIKRKGIQKLLNKYMKNNIITVPYYTNKKDIVSEGMVYNNVNTYTSLFPFCLTRDKDSIIHNSHLKKHKKSTNKVIIFLENFMKS